MIESRAEKIARMARRASHGLDPIPTEGEGICRMPDCVRPLDDQSMDGCCYLCAAELRRTGNWSTRKLLWDAGKMPTDPS